MKRHYNSEFYYNFDIEKALKNIYSSFDGSSSGSLGITPVATKNHGEIFWWSIPKFFYILINGKCIKKVRKLNMKCIHKDGWKLCVEEAALREQNLIMNNPATN